MLRWSWGYGGDRCQEAEQESEGDRRGRVRPNERVREGVCGWERWECGGLCVWVWAELH